MFFLVSDNALPLFMIEFVKMWINLYETQFDSPISLILRKRYNAYKFCWKQFYEPIKQLISLDFENFILTKQFNELNVKELMDYLRDDRIRVRNKCYFNIYIFRTNSKSDSDHWCVTAIRLY
jgi:hypothetical protein